MCQYSACAAPVCALVVVAGMSELLFAAIKLQSVWLPHVLLNIIGGLLSVVCGFGHLVALRVRHGCCETCCLRVLLVTASLVQLTALLLLVADRIGSVGFAIDRLGIKSILDQHQTMHIFGAAQDDTDVRILLTLNLLCTLVTSVQCACVCRPSPGLKTHGLHTIVANTNSSWVYNVQQAADESRPILNSSEVSTPGRNASVIRTQSRAQTKNVTLMSHRSPACGHLEFVPLKDLKSQTIDEYCSQYSIGRAVKEPMQSFKTNISPDSESQSPLRLLNTSIYSRQSFSFQPSITKPNELLVVEDDDLVTSDGEFSKIPRYPDLPAGPCGVISPLAASLDRTEGSSGSSWDDDSWATLSASARLGSLVSVAIEGAEEGVAQDVRTQDEAPL